ncbi:MAG: hypothetical protein VZQ98_10905 [Bacteroidales bacterium]|nr:hypothetical protein [Bacteroidales bacterium]
MIMETDVIKDKIQMYYKLYLDDYKVIERNDVEIEKLWIDLCDKYPQNPFYALYYSLFLIGIDEIGDYERVKNVLEPFKTDVPCTIVRCCACGWWLWEESMIEEYDFEKLLSLPMTKQERSILYYLKSQSDKKNELLYLKRSLDNCRYNSKSLDRFLEVSKCNVSEYIPSLLECERIALKSNERKLWKRNLLYKPYLYQEMELLDINWEYLYKRRKNLGLLNNPNIPPLDLRHVEHNKYFMQWVERNKEDLQGNVIY